MEVPLVVTCNSHFLSLFALLSVLSSVCVICLYVWPKLEYSTVALTSDVEHAVDVGGAADGPAPVPLALPVEHARAVPPVRVGVRLHEKGGGRVCHVLGLHLGVPSKI